MLHVHMSGVEASRVHRDGLTALMVFAGVRLPGAHAEVLQERGRVMSGFNKQVVVAALEAKLADEVEARSKRHDDDVRAWEQKRDQIQRAKKNTRQAVRDLVDGRIEVEEFATRLNVNRQYEHWFTNAAKTVPAKPKSKPSAREVGLARVIGIVKSATTEAVTVQELRALGVLDFVKYQER